MRTRNEQIRAETAAILRHARVALDPAPISRLWSMEQGREPRPLFVLRNAKLRRVLSSTSLHHASKNLRSSSQRHLRNE
jgi:hypothetical protein